MRMRPAWSCNPVHGGSCGVQSLVSLHPKCGKEVTEVVAWCPSKMVYQYEVHLQGHVLQVIKGTHAVQAHASHSSL